MDSAGYNIKYSELLLQYSKNNVMAWFVILQIKIFKNLKRFEAPANELILKYIGSKNNIKF